MNGLWQDLRYGWRTWRKNPGLAGVALLTLALGIGANTAIFSVVNGVLLRPLPYPEPERLVMIWEDPGNIPRNSVNPRNYADWREQNEAFSQVGAIQAQSVNLTGEGEPERIVSARVAATFFSILRVNPALGRAFLPTEDQPESQRVAVLSDGLWQRRFGADPNVIGQTLTLNGASTTVIGVMPSGFRFPQQAELWTPMVFTPSELSDSNRGSHYLSVVGRLEPGVSVEQAQAQMDTIYDRLREQYPRALAKWKVRVVSLSDDTVGGVRPGLFILLGAVCFVLLIACANVANLMLARATVRQREMAIRTALGASRSRLVRQLLTESILLAIVGGSLGVLFGLWGIDLLIYLNPSTLSDPPISGSVGLWSNGFEIEGQPSPPPGQGRFAYLRWSTPDYFQTMGIPLMRGRLLTESDVEGKPWVAVIDEAMAREFFPNEDPLGKRISISIREQDPREIVGIVGNVKQTSLDYQAGPHMYIAYYQTPLSYATLLVRAPGDPSVLTAAVKQEVLAVDPGQPIYSVRTMAQIISNSIADRRFNLTMLGLFAGVALVLAAVGVYGVMSYSVTQRTQEIGIRIALGASNSEVLRLIVAQGLKLTLIGVGLGLAAALALTRVLSSLLFGVSATDPPTFVATALLLALIALLACYIPARRATKVDPMVALRYE